MDRRRTAVREIRDDFGYATPLALHEITGGDKFTDVGHKQWGCTDGSKWLLTAEPVAYWQSGSGPVGEGGLCTVDAGFSNADAQVRSNGNTTNNSRMGLAFRVVDDLNWWSLFAYRSVAGSPFIFLRNCVAGTTSDLGVTTTGATNGPVKLYVVCEGSRITPYYNDVAPFGTITDATHQAATRFGMQADSQGGMRDFAIRRR